MKFLCRVLLLTALVAVCPAQGNARDARLDGLVNGMPAAGYSRLIVPGVPMSADLTSPLGSLSGHHYIIVADLQPLGGAAPLQLPGEPGALAVSSGMFPIVDGFQGLLPFGMPALLPSTGAGLSVAAPGVTTPSRLVVQSAVADPQAPNGLAITSTVGGRFVGPPVVSGTFGATSLLGQFGYALHVVDLDGDGTDEIIAGAREENAPLGADAGRVFIYSGNPPTLVQVLDDPTPQAFSEFGSSCSTGDLDGDGILDIVVGARLTDVGGQQDAGQAVVFFGPSFAQTMSFDAPSPESFGKFGHRTICGDFDADGWCDLAVASIGATSGGVPQSGALDIYYGPSLQTPQRVDNPVPGDGDRFGYRLCADDLNGDGFDDLVVAAPFKTLIGPGMDDSGAIYTLLGPTFVLDTYFPNPYPSVHGLLGADVSCVDVDGDGDKDIIAGAELGNSGGLTMQGSVWILRGPTYVTVDQYFSPQPMLEEGFGSAVDAADWDGDGNVDLLVGAFFYTDTSYRQGRAHVLLGPDYLQSVTVKEPFTGSNYQFGRRVRAGDLDGDGVAEMMVGVPQSSASLTSRAGAVYVVEF